MPHVFHKLPCWVPMALACTLAGCCHEDGTVCKDDIHLISGEINEEGNISLHFDLNTQYQGDLYVEMQPEGDEVNVFLYTRPAGRTSGKLLYAGGYQLVIPWPENAASVEVNLCGMKLDTWTKE
ncbi:hypothetical protein J5W49_13090 [Candidatus Akkermansia timonensis]|uniref:Uncharacterized protein n=2 Tax=Akkermansia TaxID=239934 RepID=A0ABM7ZJQ5_9BACT|nr:MULTISPECIES: hypothetical protein [Akkermansia]MBT9566328.1 hypothetical protein [Akkermansia muciniphila]MDU7624289.1 hypothetical protein [Akkermansia sp.]QWO95936.1 hypothetical protein J5W49_13090 [Candidatus Akkermansia timonensis]BDL44967.1 hypothetical protein Abiwalacus_25410 [Akkermansia biwaensis]